MTSRIFVGAITPLRDFTDSRIYFNEKLIAWNTSIETKLQVASDELERSPTDENRQKLEETLAEFVAGYDANCILDVVIESSAEERITGLWDPRIKDIEEKEKSAVFEISRIITNATFYDAFTHLWDWVHEEDIKLWAKVLSAFEKAPRQHKLFSNERRMAYLLIDAALKGDMIRLVVLMSYLSDDTWRALCVLALSDAVPSHLARWFLLEICFYGRHAITTADARLLKDRSASEQAYVLSIFPSAASARDLGNLWVPFEELPDSVTGILSIIESTFPKEIADMDPNFNSDENAWLDDQVFDDHIVPVLHKAGRRLCRGEVFRVVVGLINARPYLPVYELLPIVEKTLPSCIYTDQNGVVTGLISRQEVVALIESVVRFHRGLATNRERAARQRRGEIVNVDDDNDVANI